MCKVYIDIATRESGLIRYIFFTSLCFSVRCGRGPFEFTLSELLRFASVLDLHGLNGYDDDREEVIAAVSREAWPRMTMAVAREGTMSALVTSESHASWKTVPARLKPA